MKVKNPKLQEYLKNFKLDYIMREDGTMFIDTNKEENRRILDELSNIKNRKK